MVFGYLQRVVFRTNATPYFYWLIDMSRMNTHMQPQTMNTWCQLGTPLSEYQ